jgi:ABC-type transport system involved in multi-copper enzyme maturation permease subunit
MLNSILIKEFRTQLRNRKYYAFAIFYVVIICVVAFTMFWSASTSKKPLSPEYSINLSFIFFMVQMLAIGTICSGFAIYLISTERQNLTFDVLRSTLLKNYQIIFGKIPPIITYALILMFLSLPVALLIMPLNKEMAYCYLIIFISTIAFSLMGFAWSSIFKNARTAIVATYITVGIFAIGTMLVPVILNKVFQVKIAPIVTDLLNALNPFWTIFKSINGTIWSMNVAIIPTWIVLVIGYLFLSVIAIIVSIIKLK